jgi:two-component system LytT family response regulator
MRAYLVDDEKSAREVLKHHLKNIQDVNVVGEASKIEVAKKELEQLEIDILFLDISMPQGTGFDVLEMVDVSQVKVVFITAHSDYSIKAIKKGAFDYILKPIIFEEL